MPYTKEQVIVRLRQIAEQLGKTPTASYWNRHHIRPTLQPIRDLFGSWNKALEAAGLAKNAVVNYTPESLVAKLRAVAKELGQTPTKAYWEEHHIKPTTPTYQKVFGSWNKALKIASLKPHRENLTVEKILDDIKAVAEKLGHSPMTIEYEEYGSYTLPPIYSRFTTWLNALDAAGLEHPDYSAGVQNPVTPEKVIKSLQSLAETLGKTPTATEYNEIKTTYCLGTLYIHFGTYDEAVLAAGLKIPERNVGNHYPKYSEKELLDKLRAIAKELGRTPSQLESTELGLPTTTLQHRFGTYNKAVELAGLKPNKQRRLHKAICKDGHIVGSLAESAVDNFLFENDIAHAIQARVCSEKQWTCDFVVKDLWIEVDGLQDFRQELGGMTSHTDKIEYYKSHNYKFLIVNPYGSQDWKAQVLSSIQR